MVGPLPNSLSELIGHGGTVRVKCRRCARVARFSAGELARWFRVIRVRDDWKTIRSKFVCQGCGGRNPEVTYELEAPEPPPAPPAPRTADCPPGIDPQAWATADNRERKRLVRRARN